MEAAIEMGFEGCATLLDLSKPGQAHHLEAAAIGQDGALPAHEAAEPAQSGNPLGSRSQHEMVGIAKKDLRAAGSNLLRQQALYCAERADWHEGGGVDAAVGGSQPAAPGGSVAADNVELKAHAARSSRLESP